jgi:hypothetical protein
MLVSANLPQNSYVRPIRSNAYHHILDNLLAGSRSSTLEKPSFIPEDEVTLAQLDMGPISVHEHLSPIPTDIRKKFYDKFRSNDYEQFRNNRNIHSFVVSHMGSGSFFDIVQSVRLPSVSGGISRIKKFLNSPVNDRIKVDLSYRYGGARYLRETLFMPIPLISRSRDSGHGINSGGIIFATHDSSQSPILVGCVTVKKEHVPYVRLSILYKQLIPSELLTFYVIRKEDHSELVNNFFWTSAATARLRTIMVKYKMKIVEMPLNEIAYNLRPQFEIPKVPLGKRKKFKDLLYENFLTHEKGKFDDSTIETYVGLRMG